MSNICGFGVLMDNFDYFVKEDLSSFVGKWIAILDNKVVASGNSFKEVAELVDEKFKGKKPLLARVPEKIAQVL